MTILVTPVCNGVVIIITCWMTLVPTQGLFNYNMLLYYCFQQLFFDLSHGVGSDFRVKNSANL